MSTLLGDFAFGFVGGVFDFGVEAFEEAGEEGVLVELVVLDFVGVGDVAGEIGEDDAPGEGVLPGAAVNADVLSVLGDPDAEDFEGGFVALGGGGRVEVFFICCHGRHLFVRRCFGRWFDYVIEYGVRWFGVREM